MIMLLVYLFALIGFLSVSLISFLILEEKWYEFETYREVLKKVKYGDIVVIREEFYFDKTHGYAKGRVIGKRMFLVLVKVKGGPEVYFSANTLWKED